MLEFLSDDVEFVFTGPSTQALIAIRPARKDKYTCLKRPLNFIAATTEFELFTERSFG